MFEPGRPSLAYRGQTRHVVLPPVAMNLDLIRREIRVVSMSPHHRVRDRSPQWWTRVVLFPAWTYKYVVIAKLVDDICDELGCWSDHRSHRSRLTRLCSLSLNTTSRSSTAIVVAHLRNETRSELRTSDSARVRLVGTS